MQKSTSVMINKIVTFKFFIRGSIFLRRSGEKSMMRPVTTGMVDLIRGRRPDGTGFPPRLTLSSKDDIGGCELRTPGLISFGPCLEAREDIEQGVSNVEMKEGSSRLRFGASNRSDGSVLPS
jgi:hypothetical protein